MSLHPDTQALCEAIEEQARVVEACSDPATRAAALGLLRSTMDLHKDALTRILEIVKETEAEETLANLGNDPLVRSVLVLHDLHPDDLPTRINAALANLTPKLQRHGADASVLGIEDKAVRILLDVKHSCGSTFETLKLMIERELLDAAPDAEIIVDTATPPTSGFVSINSLLPVADQRPKEEGVAFVESKT
jgi:Fe-S cluster biogenesis protein NfuA